MPYELRVDADLIRVTQWGDVRNSELTELFERLVIVEQAMARMPHRLADLRGVVDCESTYADVFDLARQRHDARFPNAFKVAVLCVTPMQYAYFRMFQMLSDNPQITLAAFADEQEALAWLSAPTMDPPDSVSSRS